MPRDDKPILKPATNLMNRLRDWVTPENGVEDRSVSQASDDQDIDWEQAERDYRAYLDRFAMQADPGMDKLQEQRKARDVLAERLKMQCQRFAERTGWGDLELDSPPARLSPEERELGRNLARQRSVLARESDQLERRFDELSQKSWDKSIPSDRPAPDNREQPGRQASTPDRDYKAFLMDVRHAWETKLDSRQQREFVNLVGGRANMKRDDFLNDKAVAFLDRHTDILKIEDRQDNGRRVQMSRLPDTDSLSMTYKWRVAEIGGKTLAQGMDSSRDGAAESLGLARDRHKARSHDRHLVPGLSMEETRSDDAAEQPGPDKPVSGWAMLRDEDEGKSRDDWGDEDYEIVDLDDPDYDPGKAPARGRDRERGDHGHEL